jgi:hypothetical protein
MHWIPLLHDFKLLMLFTPLSSSPTFMSATILGSTASRKFTMILLGCSANAIELLVPAAPSVHDATDLKARCFDYLANLLLSHTPL